ncbi:MAG: hypothetical protein IPM53_30060 [Anaerolineaceae bacterium]|nr:hypothetical protein [Anaerolineaceae bacterium]
MRERYFNCYTLGRSAPAQDRLDYVLPCRREQALQLFALLIDKKAILVPYGHTVAFRVPNTMLSVCRVSSYTMATFLWRCGYLVGSTNPVTRFMDKVGRHIQLFRHLHRDEQSIDEVVLELFYSTQGQTPCIDLPDPEVYPEDLLLARLHFAEISPAQTILRLFIGWTDTAPLSGLDELYSLLQQYIDLLHQVLLPNGSPALQAERPLRVERSPNEMAADKDEQTLPEFVEAPEVDVVNDGLKSRAEAAAVEEDATTVILTYADAEAPPPQTPDQQPLPNWQIQAIEGQDWLHSETEFRIIEEEGDGNELEHFAEEAAQPVGENDEVEPQPPPVPVPSEDELQLYRGMKPPRLYTQTLSNICIMVAERQRQIDAWGKVPRIKTFKSPLRPSRNTLLKIPELFTHWHDVRYRWNLVTWLHHYSGHNETEISEILSTLYHSLSKAEWAAVTSAGREEETHKSRRHHAQEEGKSRPAGQVGAVN